MRTMQFHVQTCVEWLRVHLRSRRDEHGGITDETAMIGILLAAAVIVAGIVFGLVIGVANNLDFDIPGVGSGGGGGGGGDGGDGGGD